MKVTVVPIGIDALGTIHKGLEKGLKELKIIGEAETVQTTELRWAKIPRKVLGT